MADLIVILFLILFVGFIVYRMVKRKKANPNGCAGCSISDCPMKNIENLDELEDLYNKR